MIFSNIQIPGTTAAAPADTTATQTARNDWSALKAVSFDDLVNRIASTMVDFAIHLAVAILVFYVGKFLIRKLYKLTANILYHRKIDKSLTTFVLSLVNMVLYFILVVTVIGILGINTSSFIAIFASAGVAIGMALSGTLQNFAGGVLILLLKPYKVGDYIEAQGYSGVVREIQIFSTIISTPDNKSIIVPNGPLSTGSINNWSREELRRIDWTVGISYGDDVDKARELLIGLLLADPRILQGTLADESRTDDATPESKPEKVPEVEKRSFWKRIFHKNKSILQNSDDDSDSLHKQLLSVNVDRTPQVVLSQLADSSVNLSVRAWVKSADYWDVYFKINEQIYKTLPENGINFPFPQLDVHLPAAQA